MSSKSLADYRTSARARTKDQRKGKAKRGPKLSTKSQKVRVKS